MVAKDKVHNRWRGLEGIMDHFRDPTGIRGVLASEREVFEHTQKRHDWRLAGQGEPGDGLG